MVWFQCEDCGDNLKKPKLPNHFRVCSANKLSCIDCGQTFGQQSVQGHTQCITETEKYGPKGQGKASNGTPAKPNSSSKQKPEVDINVGLSERAPWFCSLCNTSATSRQTLLLHADGKKHRAKARAFHASKQPAKQTEESTPNAEGLIGNGQKIELCNGTEDVKEPHRPDVALVLDSSEVETKSLSSSKKRKVEESENDGARQKAGGDVTGELGNGEVIQVGMETEGTKSQVKKAKQVESIPPKEDGKKKIKWKKLITSALKSDPDGAMKMRKLRKHVLKTLKESGSTEDESQLVDKLERKIDSSSKFIVDGKYVRLAARS